ncbi:hypothetical protein ACFXMT_34180 [Streptomyces mirabilis]|uniref:hypothetical protein n=1 Tax=Streptomyces mirabilis TaxID=68239 RepID=UPI0036C5A15B
MLTSNSDGSVFADLSPLIASTAQWLTCSYPSGDSPMDRVLSEVQARQAVTVAAWLRYPTPLDAELVVLAGPRGSARLDWATGADGGVYGPETDPAGGQAWRTWVDEVVASWAACLLTDSQLAESAIAALAECSQMGGVPVGFRRLAAPGDRDRKAAALLRHPDLLAPIAELHREGLLARLAPGPAPLTA